ncbi:hypothetical protein ACIGBH_39390 [Streptomyces sp. NPDC085929]|uniref:hypothetical protein n=1 Tax=Streptomyces sp. NPDC085929 TaxID=3365739 RepID=UPI0037D906E4
MIERRPLGTGPRPATDTPATPDPRARLATGHPERSAAAPGRRRLGPGRSAADH